MAIERLREDIIQWNITLISGKITCIPYANYEAYREKKRQITHNLNRIFWQDEQWGIHDTARYIESLILQSDFVLDLHSFSAWKEAFIFNDYNTEEVNTIIHSIPIEHVMIWWTELYTWLQELDTIGFAKKNNIPGITIECWQNEDSQSIDTAYACIFSALKSYNIIKEWENVLHKNQIWISVDTIIRKQEDFIFINAWKNFDPIEKDEIIWKNLISHKSISSPYTWLIIMPNSSVENWWEWCYLWKIITNP